MRIRLAAPEDAAALARVRQRAWEAAYRGIYPDKLIDAFDYAGHEQRFLRQMDNSSLNVIVLEEGEIVGFAVFGAADTELLAPACLHSLYPVPEAHRKGYGTAAMNFVRDWCKQNGYTSFYNSCNPHNQNAMKFYNAAGGGIVKTDTGYDDPAADQVYFVHRVGDEVRISPTEKR